MKYYYVFILTAVITSYAAEFQSSAYLSFRAAEEQTWLAHIQNAEMVTNDTTIDVRFYHLNIDVAVHKKYIRGDVLIRFDANVQNLNAIKLDLNRAFQIDSLTGNISSYTFKDDVLAVTLDDSYQKGEAVSLRVYYHGEPPLINDLKGLRYEVHGQNEPVIANLSTPYLAHYWWPCKDGPGDKADSVYIDVTIPDTTIRDIPLSAVSNGRLQRVTRVNNKRTFFWRERYPVVPYYINVAISNYTPFQQWSRGERKGTPIDYNVFSESRSTTMTTFQDFPDVFNFFSSLFGPYPFKNEKYAMCELGYYGGIEKQTNTIMGGLNEDWFGVAVHELAHMWFADMITCKTWNHGWLNEGFATYAEALWV